MDFEQNFIFECLEGLEHILTETKELEKAIYYYTDNQALHPRHQLNSKITDSLEWSEQDKRCLSAAVFETIARVSTLFYSENEEEIRKIHSANANFLEQYLPEITKNTHSRNRIESVKTNCQRIKTELKNQHLSNADNPYLFFSTASAGLAVLAVSTALFLSRKS